MFKVWWSVLVLASCVAPPEPLTQVLPLSLPSELENRSTAADVCLASQRHALAWSPTAQLVQVQGVWVDANGRSNAWSCAYRDHALARAAFDAQGRLVDPASDLPELPLAPTWPNSDEALLRVAHLDTLPFPVPAMRLEADGWHFEAAFLRLRLDPLALSAVLE
ncbi:MAG: hypothetical protein ACO1RX_22680 [Candidatus Sericytochromatia bacterium]